MSFTASTTHAHSLCASFRGQSLNNKIATSSATTTTARATPKFTVVSAASVGKVKFDGSSAGEANLDLKVARSEVAKGIVHKYVVMVRLNARRVSVRSRRCFRFLSFFRVITSSYSRVAKKTQISLLFFCVRAHARITTTMCTHFVGPFTDCISSSNSY